MFLRECSTDFLSAQNYAPVTDNLYRYRLSALSRYEDEVRKPVYQFSSSEMHEAFRHATDNPKIAQALKTLLDSYFIWLSAQGINVTKGQESLKSIDHEALKHKRSKQYFYGLPQLLAKIDSDTNYAARVERRIPSDYRMPISAFILLWYGLKIPEIVTIRKDDILKQENKVRSINIHPRAYALLESCAEATFYTKNHNYSSCTFYYTESEYLLRTSESNAMDENTLRVMISKFNKAISPSESYKTEKIYWSGVFFRAYQAEIERGGFSDIIGPAAKISFFGELFNESYSNADQVYKRLAEYNEYTSILRK